MSDRIREGWDDLRAAHDRAQQVIDHKRRTVEQIESDIAALTDRRDRLRAQLSRIDVEIDRLDRTWAHCSPRFVELKTWSWERLVEYAWDVLKMDDPNGAPNPTRLIEVIVERELRDAGFFEGET